MRCGRTYDGFDFRKPPYLHNKSMGLLQKCKDYLKEKESYSFKECIEEDDFFVEIFDDFEPDIDLKIEVKEDVNL
jgi:hypothetical protein